MTLLDHSSIDSLLAGLQVHDEFRFLYEVGGTTEPWKLQEVYSFDMAAFLAVPTAPGDAVCLRVLQGNSMIGYHLWLDSDKWLVAVQRFIAGAKWLKITGFSRMRVARETTADDDAADGTLQRADRRRDRGLADIFGTAS